ncbi:hypothetical protein I4U23_009537 [Adineta vaga]|nr:hypothetical protein I4U23_009537 [Adineta vaga]
MNALISYHLFLMLSLARSWKYVSEKQDHIPVSSSMAPRLYVICIVLMLVLCQASVVHNRSVKCDNPVNCLADPCRGATCKNYPTAICRANYCGGCNKDFYVGCKRVDCGNDT